MAGIRLQVILSRAGVASRRAAEEMIRKGKVTVNGETIRELGTRADPCVDSIRVEGRALERPRAPRVIMMNKPRGVVTTLDDPEGRRTVAELLPRTKGRLFPVGRLDYHTEGLLLLTNDGDLANGLMHPATGPPKVYEAKVRGAPSPAVLQRFARGLMLDGRRTRPARTARLRPTREGNTWVEVQLHEGRRNQIRRMFLILGHPVQKLRRVRIGPISLGDLKSGETRELDPREVIQLRRACGMGGAARPRRSSGTPARKAGPPLRQGSGSATRRGSGTSTRRAAGSATKKRSGPSARRSSRSTTHPRRGSGHTTRLREAPSTGGRAAISKPGESRGSSRSRSASQRRPGGARSRRTS